MFDIKENLKKLPDCPGVYIHRDGLGNIIYIGKAVNLRNRVRQYFQSPKNMPPKVRSMAEQIAEFEYITVESEMEALILECNLIKKHRPKYNILLRDDKTYPYIKVTDEQWPRVVKTRQYRRDGGTYFGPYSDAGAVNKIIDLLNSSFSLKRCSAVAFPEGFRPCLNYHINQCPGICNGSASREEYQKAIEGAVEFLKGNDGKLIKSLKSKMEAAAEAMEYEAAAEYRDYIEAAKSLAETQRVVLHHSSDADIVIKITEESREEDTYVALFSVREGKLVGRETFKIEDSASIDEGEGATLSAFLNQHYSRLPHIPKEIILKRLPENWEAIEKLLEDRAGHKVKLIKPERGEKKALLELASKDARELARTIRQKAEASRQRRENLGRELWSVLSDIDPGSYVGQYDGREFRAEAYDISNTNGVDTVGAMVVFKGTKAEKQSYRKFKVKSVRGQDDYGSMREVLSRRFLRVFKEDEKFSTLPDFILMDGGKGHVSVAMEVVCETGFDIPVIGMVKDDYHRTRALIYKKNGEWTESPLASKPILFKYVGAIQEEVHRFAIEYHRKLRSKNVEKSVLDEIQGIGPERRRALLETFGSVEEIRKQDVDSLRSVRGMNAPAAQKVFDFFHG